MVTAFLAACVLWGQGRGFDWAKTGADGPLDNFSMQATFTSNSEPFDGVVPGDPAVEVKGGQMHAKIRVTFYAKSSGRSETVWTSVCANACQGPPPAHGSHQDCDRLCDRPCQAVHHFEAMAHDGVSGWNLDGVKMPFYDRFFQAVDMFKSRGLDVSDEVDWLTSIRDDFLAEFNDRASKEQFVFDKPHIGQNPYQPCFWGEYTVMDQGEVVMAVIESVAVVQQKSKDGKAWEDVGEIPMGDPVEVPVSQSSRRIGATTKSYGVRCFCEGTSMLDPRVPALGFDMNWRHFPTAEPGTGYAALIDRCSFKNSKVEVTGVNMNWVEVGLTGDPMMRLHLPAGTLLVPDDAGVQVMVVTDGADISGVVTSAYAPTRVRVMCTQMAKKEPTAKTKFAIAAPADGTVSWLAGNVGKSRFRGPWDQAQMWMHTDASTYDECKKVMIPMSTQGRYLRSLDELFRSDVAFAKRKRLEDAVTLDMLADGNCGAKSLYRFLRVLWKRDSKAVVAKAAQLAKGWAAQDDPPGEQLGALAWFLGAEKSAEAHQAMYDVLAATPEKARRAAVQQGCLEAVSADLFSRDKATVLKAVSVLEAWAAPTYAKALDYGKRRVAKAVVR